MSGETTLQLLNRIEPPPGGARRLVEQQLHHLRCDGLTVDRQRTIRNAESALAESLRASQNGRVPSSEKTDDSSTLYTCVRKGVDCWFVSSINEFWDSVSMRRLNTAPDPTMLRIRLERIGSIWQTNVERASRKALTRTLQLP